MGYLICHESAAFYADGQEEFTTDPSEAFCFELEYDAWGKLEELNTAGFHGLSILGDAEAEDMWLNTQHVREVSRLDFQSLPEERLTPLSGAPPEGVRKGLGDPVHEHSSQSDLETRI